MKKLLKVGIAIGLSSIFGAMGDASAFADDSLESQLQGLSLPANEMPVQTSTEKLYSVQSRYSTLKGRHELDVGGAKNFSPASFIVSNQVDLTYRYHISDRWSIGLNGSSVYNSRSAAGDRLLQQEGLLPDAAYVNYRANLMGTFNAFYGKFRVSLDRVFYFDQYFSVGPGLVWMNTGRSTSLSADAGFSLWFGKKWSVRFGLKDNFYREKRMLSSSMTNDLMGHLDFGILLGGGDDV